MSALAMAPGGRGWLHHLDTDGQVEASHPIAAGEGIGVLGRTSTLVLVLTDRGDLLACPLDGDEPVWRIRVPAPDPAHPARVADMLLETWSATVTDCRCY